MSTAALFERLAPRYDELWTETAVGRAQRNAVWRVMDKLYGAGDCVLDIGCGTGEDAAHLGARGVLVYGIDASPAMVERARARGVRAEVRQIENLCGADPLVRAGRPRPALSATNRRLAVVEGDRSGGGASSARLDKLKHVPPLFDGAFSNFGALNCVEDVAGVARELGALVRPGGYVAICTMGRFCVWETLYYGLRLVFKRALRRLAGRAGEIRYPTVRQLHADFAADFELVCWSGVGMLVPPSYVRLSARIVNVLARFDRLPILRACADHRLLVFKRK
jgi:SAM-dependent methyltransferase